MQSFEDHAAVVRMLADSDVAAALLYVNGLTRFRFRGLFSFEMRTVRSLVVVDRLGEPPPSDPQLTLSYCHFVRDIEEPFEVLDARTDSRLQNHPKRHLIRAYWGMPLRDRTGRTLGSICHFDREPIAGRQRFDLVEFMELVAPLFASALLPKKALNAASAGTMQQVTGPRRHSC